MDGSMEEQRIARLFSQNVSDAQFYKTKANDYVNKSLMATCPFDKSHVMKSSRLQYHIVRCMKNYTGQKVPCPYNHCEYYEPEDLIAHYPVCPSRLALEVHRHNSERNREESVRTNDACAFAAPILPGSRHTDEDWDDE